MKLTREQFNDIGNFYLDDFPINSSNQDLMFEIFNNLPKHERMLAIEWGFNDTVFRDNVFEFLCENQLNMTCEEYYKSDIFKKYFNENVTIDIDFKKMSI
jgi:hypothetical protein